MFKNQLNQNIILRKNVQIKNEFGEYVDSYNEINVKAFIESKRDKIVSEKYGLVETIIFIAFIDPSVDISKEDKILYNGNEYEIKSIRPILDFGGNIILKEIIFQDKE